ncbi:MAG: universal stress protein [Planctomycetota bacterium]
MKRFRKLAVGLALTPSGSDLTLGTRRAAEQAMWLAKATGAELLFVHSTWQPESAGEVAPTGVLSDEGSRALEQLRSDAVERGIETELLVGEEQPWLLLVRLVLAGRAGLVLVGTRNSAGKRRLGSVTWRLLRTCPAPVWAVRPDGAFAPHRILAATDLSAVGDRATELALSIAALSSGEVEVLHSWQVPFELQLSSARLGEEEYQARRGAIEEAALAHIRATLSERGEVRAATRILCDAPVRAILDTIDADMPDLLVLGTVSRGGLAGLLVGNTAEKVLARAATSILAVKPDDFVCPVEG